MTAHSVILSSENEEVPRALVLGVFLVALGTLFFEVLLTRIFSVTLWYHFGFMAISLALLGTASSAVLCFLYPERLAGRFHLRNMAISAALFATVAPASVVYHVTVRLPGFDDLGAFYLAFGLQLTLLFVSFFAAGLCISIALFHCAARIGTVYSFDLVGAALGAVLVVPMMYGWSPMALVFVVSAVSFLAALGMARSAGASMLVQAGLALATVAALSMAAVNDRMGLVEIGSVKAYGKGQSQKAKPENVYERWSPISRVTVERSHPKWSVTPLLIATNDAGAPTVLTRFDGDFEKVLWAIRRDPSQSGFFLKKDANVLIIGVGGGRDVLSGLATGQAKITAVEINPLMEDIVRGPFADHIGNIFDDPKVTLHIQEGRNFVAASDEMYDLIVFSMIDSWSSAAAAGAYVFNENSLYTIEAIDDYMTHLEPDGLLSMTRYYDWDESLRVATMFASYLESRGIKDIHQRVMVLQNSMKRAAVTVLLKNGLFTLAESEKILEISNRGDATVLYAPHIEKAKLGPALRRAAFERVLNPSAYNTTRANFIERRERDISPPTDDRPFFFYTQRAFDMLRVNPNEHAARRLALPMLYGMAMVFGLIGAVTIFLPLYLRSGTEIARAPNRFRSLAYFSMLGLGFMLVEISLIQRLTIFLGHPTWSFVVVLATILFASGIGSQYSSRWSSPNPAKLCQVLAILTALLLFNALVVYNQFIDFMWLPKVARIVVTTVVIAPAGFLMGMCFPMGIGIVRHFHATLVPWGWGVNGAFSVFASVLSIVIALAVGFRAAMLLGVACYAVAYFLIRGMPSQPEPELTTP